jgi:hypothetical protein
MSRRHDWGHRLAEIVEVEGFSRPTSLKRHLERLEMNAATFESDPMLSSA